MELRSGNQICTPSKQDCGKSLPFSSAKHNKMDSGLRRKSVGKSTTKKRLSSSSSSIDSLSSSFALLEKENSSSSLNSSLSFPNTSFTSLNSSSNNVLETSGITNTKGINTAAPNSGPSASNSANNLKLQLRVSSLLQTAKEEGDGQLISNQVNWLDERSKECQTSFAGRNFSFDPVENETQCDLYGKQERVLKATIVELEEKVVDRSLKLQGIGKLVEERAYQIQTLKADFATMRNETHNMLNNCANSIAPWLNGITELTNEKDENLANMTSMLEEESMRRRKLHNELQELRGNIRVFCRIRPPGTNNAARAKHSATTANTDTSSKLSGNKSTAGLETVLPINRVTDTQISIRTENNNTNASSSTKIMELDHIFGPQSSQQQVFKEVEPLVTSVMDGYHSCILAYGQTGSGKTYTMEGSIDQPGVNRRTLTELFNIKAKRESTGLVKVDVEVSMVEIYNETVRDLLVSTKKGAVTNGKDPILLDIRQGPEGVYLPGCQRRAISTLEDVNQVLNYGKRNRATSSTGMNAQSSRSHSVVMVYTNVKPTKEGLAQRDRIQKELQKINIELENGNDSSSSQLHTEDEKSNILKEKLKKKADLEKKMELDRCVAKSGRLILVDLAGSERLGKTGAEGKALKEAQNINKSLSALGDVISSLRQRQQQLQQQNSRGSLTTSTSSGKNKNKANDVHIPYRNSKLTYLLQDSLSSDNKALMIIQVSPDQTDVPESVCSLNFASRVACIEFGGLSSSGGGSGTVVKLKNEVRTLREALDSLKEKYNTLQSKYNESSEEHVILKEQHEKTKLQLENLEKQTIFLQDEIKTKETLNSSESAKIFELEKEKINMTALLDEKDITVQAKIEIITSLKADVKRLQSLLLTQQQEETNLHIYDKNSCQEKDQKITELEKELEKMRKEMSSLNYKLQEERQHNAKSTKNLTNEKREIPLKPKSKNDEGGISAPKEEEMDNMIDGTIQDISPIECENHRKLDELKTKTDTSFFAESDDNDDFDDLDIDIPFEMSTKFMKSMSKHTQAAIMAKQKQKTHDDIPQKSKNNFQKDPSVSDTTTDRQNSKLSTTNRTIKYPVSPAIKQKLSSNLSSVLSSVAQAQEVARSLTPKKRKRESLEFTSNYYPEENQNDENQNSILNSHGIIIDQFKEVSETFEEDLNTDYHTRKKAKKVTFHIRKSQEHILQQQENDNNRCTGQTLNESIGTSDSVLRDQRGRGYESNKSINSPNKNCSTSNNNRSNHPTTNVLQENKGLQSSNNGGSVPRFLASTKSSAADYQYNSSAGQAAFQMGLASRIESTTPNRMKKPSRVLNQGNANGNLRPGSRASKWR